MAETGINRVDARGRIVAVGNLFTRRGEAYREIRLLIEVNIKLELSTLTS